MPHVENFLRVMSHVGLGFGFCSFSWFLSENLLCDCWCVLLGSTNLILILGFAAVFITSLMLRYKHATHQSVIGFLCLRASNTQLTILFVSSSCSGRCFFILYFVCSESLSSLTELPCSQKCPFPPLFLSGP